MSQEVMLFVSSCDVIAWMSLTIREFDLCPWVLEVMEKVQPVSVIICYRV